MKYLKIILTIIAINLTVTTIQNLNIISKVKAGTKETIDVNIVEVGGSRYGELEVNCSNCNE